MSKVTIDSGILRSYLEFYKEYIRIFQDEKILGEGGQSLEGLLKYLINGEADGVVQSSVETVVTLGTILKQGHKIESLDLKESFSIASGFQVMKTLLVEEGYVSECFCKDIEVL